MSGLKNVLLAALSGWVMNLAFPSFGWWPAAPIGLAMLWVALERATFWKGLGLGMVAGLGFFLPLIRWISVGVGPIPWIALVLLQSLFVALWAGSWALVRRRKWLEGRLWLEPLVFAMLWVSAEILRSLVPWGGFPWGRLAFSQLGSPVARLAWLGGTSLVSLAVAIAGGCLGLAWEAARGRRIVVPALALGGAVAVMSIGLVIPLSVDAETGTLRVGVVQGSVPNLGLDATSQARLVLHNHVSANEVMVAHETWVPDLVVWPENAADFDPRTDRITHDALTSSAALDGAPILVGTVDYSPPNGRYNVSLLWTSDGVAIDQYEKRHPAPFAEYIPWRKFAHFFSSAVDRVKRDMVAGTEVGTITLPSPRLGRDVIVGDVICFEVAYDGLVRDAVNGGAELIVVQTNNANFGLTPESVQQLAMTRLRAIETGRTAIQASTVGVSAVVAPDGTVIQSTRLFTADYMLQEVPLRTSLTPAMRIGAALDWVLLLAPVAALLLLGLTRLKGRWEWE